MTSFGAGIYVSTIDGVLRNAMLVLQFKSVESNQKLPIYNFLSKKQENYKNCRAKVKSVYLLQKKNSENALHFTLIFF